ncbi:hypothetical protein [Metabacillus sp. Hm71]|uniref:hypothetical protein n=1 Tax=Metabacillus sp. Hm71 TaxID=3450743 RepID=UPI003F43A6AE
MLVLNFEEFVNRFATERQKQSFIKNNGNVNKRTLESMIKTAKQEFEIVEVEGRGSKRKIKIDGQREELAEREDNRKFNGEGQLPVNYEQGFPVMILEYLIKSNVSVPTTTTKLLFDFCFIPDELYIASKAKYNQDFLKIEIATLKEKGVIDITTQTVVYDYIDKEITRLTNHFMGYIKKLEDAKLIIHNKHTIGELVDENGVSIYIELTTHVVDKVAKMRRKLQQSPEFKHLTLKEINRYRNKSDVKEYWIEHDKLLYEITDEYSCQLKLLRTFEAHTLFLQAGDNPIKRWLWKKENRGAIDLYNSDELQYYLKNREQFHEARGKYVVELAKGRQNNALKENNKFLDEFGGKEKQVVINFDDSEWIKNKKLMFLGLYVEAYEKLQEHYGYSFN